MSKLALNGGEPVRKTPFPRYITLSEDEKHAVMEVLDSGVLSQFLGTWSPDFYGGPRIQKFEREWEAHFGVKHAITVNSATSGLYAAVGAAGISPGDEVIASPYTMSASATAAIIYGGIPVFADIDENIFCLSVDSVRERITPHTKAIIVVDIFGQPADMNDLMKLAREHNLIVIEDN
jgi:perosamine synthetase